MKDNEAPSGVNVPVGVSTVLGSGMSVAAFAGALIAFVAGDYSSATVELLATGLVSLALVVGGRYAQAVAAVLADAIAKAGR